MADPETDGPIWVGWTVLRWQRRRAAKGTGITNQSQHKPIKRAERSVRAMPETETELDRLARELLQRPLSEAKAPPEVWERAQQIAAQRWREKAERLEAERARLNG